MLDEVNSTELWFSKDLMNIHNSLPYLFCVDVLFIIFCHQAKHMPRLFVEKDGLWCSWDVKNFPGKEKERERKQVMWREKKGFSTFSFLDAMLLITVELYNLFYEEQLKTAID